MLRKAQEKDISRIAEILIFTKRQTYRPIFKNDHVSFNVMQVISEAQRIKDSGEIDNMYVFDDGIVKAVLTIKENSDKIYITDFYVDTFFQGLGIGTEILNKIVGKYNNKEIHLNPLDKNTKAIKFYENYGFKYTGNKEEFLDSGFYMLDYFLPKKV